MSEQREQALSTRASTPIHLDNFIEAVTRGVMRALEEQEDVAGHLVRQDRPRPFPIVLAGFIPPYALPPSPFPPFQMSAAGGNPGTPGR